MYDALAAIHFPNDDRIGSLRKFRRVVLEAFKSASLARSIQIDGFPKTIWREASECLLFHLCVQFKDGNVISAGTIHDALIELKFDGV